MLPFANSTYLSIEVHSRVCASVGESINKAACGGKLIIFVALLKTYISLFVF